MLLSAALQCATGMVEGEAPLTVVSNLGLSVMAAVLAPSDLVNGFGTVAVSGITSSGQAGPGRQGVAITVVSVSSSLSSWVIGTEELDDLKDYETSIVAVGSCTLRPCNYFLSRSFCPDFTCLLWRHILLKFGCHQHTLILLKMFDLLQNF